MIVKSINLQTVHIYILNKKKMNMKHHVQMGRIPTITENFRPIILISVSQIEQLWQYPFIADICIWKADNCIRNIHL